MSKPGFFFYTGDWLKDTRTITAEARGCWIDWLCLLYESGGALVLPVSAWGNYAGVSEETARHILNQLELTNVANVEWQNDSKTMAKLSNRRMVREIQNRKQLREVRSAVGKKGAETRWQKWQPSSSSSLNINSSLRKEKKPKATPLAQISPPDFIGKEAWEEWLAHRRRKRATVTVEIARRLFSKLEQLEAMGYRADDVLRKCIDRNWAGLEIDWIHKNGANDGREKSTEPKGWSGLREALRRQNEPE